MRIRIIKNIFTGEFKTFEINENLAISEILSLYKITNYQLFINGESYMGDENIILKNDDFLTIKIIPADPIGWFIAAGIILVPLTIAGGSALYEWLTRVPSIKKTQTSPSIRGSTNNIRGNEKLPILLGEYRVYPDIAAIPYSVYKNNNQYLRQLFCFGYSNVNIDLSSIKIENSPISKYEGITIEPGVNQWFQERIVENLINIELQNDGTATPTIRTTSSNSYKANIGIAAPSGIYKINKDGDREPASVSFKISWRAENGDWNVAHNITLNLNVEKFRKMYSINLIGSTKGLYEIKVERTNAESTLTTFNDSIYLDVIQSFTQSSSGNKSAIINQPAFSFISVEIKATNQLYGIIDRLNALCSLNARAFNEISQSWELANTNNPASMIIYLLTNNKVNPRPLGDHEIDWDDFQEFYNFCESKNFTCNSWITSEYSILEFCEFIASANLASLRKAGGKIGIDIDREVKFPTQMFTPRNAWNFSMNKDFGTSTRNIKVKYVDEDLDYLEVERLVSLNEQNEVVFDSEVDNEKDLTVITLFGVTNSTQASKVMKIRLLEINRRKRIFNFNTDIEGLVCTKGDLILFEHDSFFYGLGEGRISYIKRNMNDEIEMVRIDSEVEMSKDKTYGMTVRTSEGFNKSIKLSNNKNQTSQNLYLDQPLSLNLEIEDLIAFGEINQETIELLITGLQRGENETCSITAVDYCGEIYKDEPIPFFAV